MIDHPDLDRLLEKHLPKANVRPAKDIVENLKSKVLFLIYFTVSLSLPRIIGFLHIFFMLVLCIRN